MDSAMDNELAESVTALKDVFSRRGIPATFGEAQPETVEQLGEALGVPNRYRAFLLATDPVDVEVATPVERVRLIPSSELASEQPGEGAATWWRGSWVVIGRSALFGDPYFLDVKALDTAGDCPVYTAPMAAEGVHPRLCVSSFRQFLRILAVSMEVAVDFEDEDATDADDDDDDPFRSALAPRLEAIDPAALRAGHWT